MSSPILQIRAEHIDTPEKRTLYRVTIVGCGLNGITHANIFANSGFKVICADTDQSIVSLLARAKTPPIPRWMEPEWRKHLRTGQLNCTSDVKSAVSQADIILIAIHARIDRRKVADHCDLENAAKQVGANFRKGSLVLASGISGIGVTEDTLEKALQDASGFKVGLDFGLAYSPFTPSLDRRSEREAKQGRIVAATDTTSLNVTSTLLQMVMPEAQILKTNSIRVAEAAAIFGSAWNTVGTGLSNEFSSLCEKMRIDYLEALELMNRTASRELPFPAILDDKLLDKSYLLLDVAENSGVRLELPVTAIDTEKNLMKHVVNLSQEALRSCAKTIRRAKVSLLGLSRTPDGKREIGETIRKLVKMFEIRGAKLRLYDPYFDRDRAADSQLNLKTSLNEALEGADCIVILIGHDQFKNMNLQKMKLIVKMPAALIDLAGVFEPDKVEKEGMVYRGLGRGLWTR
jgi:UDP-N-acetyl-D-glucosamine dehydrogenase